MRRKDRTYIVFEYVDIPDDPINSYANTHTCNSLEVFSWIQEAYNRTVNAVEGSDILTIAVHELGDRVFSNREP
jgi:hypothetical protein